MVIWLATMWSLKCDLLFVVMLTSTLVVVSLLLLLHIFLMFFLSRTASSSGDDGGEVLPVSATTAKTPEDVGVDASTVDSLPTFSYNNDSDEASDCMVCLGILEDDGTGKVLPKCNHAFHGGCIGEWLTKSHSMCCPICRTPVGSSSSSPAAAEVVVAGDVDEEAGFGGGVVSHRSLRFDVVAELQGELHLPLLLLY